MTIVKLMMMLIYGKKKSCILAGLSKGLMSTNQSLFALYTFIFPSFSLLTTIKLCPIGLFDAGINKIPSGASPVTNILMNSGLAGSVMS
jgi:hypothetical protein